MYPTLFHAVKDILGLEIPILKIVMTYGFFMFLGFTAAVWTSRSELIRRENNGQLQSIYREPKAPNKFFNYLIALILGFLIAWKLGYFIGHFDEVLDSPQQFMISSKGNIGWGITGAALLAFLNFLELRKNATAPGTGPVQIHPYQHIPNILIVAAITGLIGSNLFAHLENISELIQNPGVLFKDPLTGGSFLGALLGGAAGVAWRIQKYEINWKIMGDVVAPGLILAYGIGRMGCHLSGDGDWGIENISTKPEVLAFLPDWLWSYDYPDNIHGVILNNPVWPTSLYESIICIILFFVLWNLRKRIKYAGMLFSVYLIFVGLERLLIEKIRINPEYVFMNVNMTQAEMISTVLLLLGVLGLYYFRCIQKIKPI